MSDSRRFAAVGGGGSEDGASNRLVRHSVEFGNCGIETLSKRFKGNEEIYMERFRREAKHKLSDGDV